MPPKARTSSKIAAFVGLHSLFGRYGICHCDEYPSSAAWNYWRYLNVIHNPINSNYAGVILKPVRHLMCTVRMIQRSRWWWSVCLRTKWCCRYVEVQIINRSGYNRVERPMWQMWGGFTYNRSAGTVFIRL